MTNKNIFNNRNKDFGVWFLKQMQDKENLLCFGSMNDQRECVWNTSSAAWHHLFMGSTLFSYECKKPATWT